MRRNQTDRLGGRGGRVRIDTSLGIGRFPLEDDIDISITGQRIDPDAAPVAGRGVGGRIARDQIEE